jgi:hypothetical protein
MQKDRTASADILREQLGKTSSTANVSDKASNSKSHLFAYKLPVSVGAWCVVNGAFFNMFHYALYYARSNR